MDMKPLQMLTGAEIVDRGRNVSNCILPEVGTKEVTPNGSWLEAKQIQTALEKRKSLVAAERIDKVGALSHAEWSDKLKLAEVTQQVGGHWQYMGHNVNGTFFLLPEEALYLIETNCLLLKHNQVTVSLQKAYSLLLEDNTALTQYKVYASLSRVGYKVFRHNPVKPMTDVVIKSPESSDLLKENVTKMDTTDSNSIELLAQNENTTNCDSTSSKKLPNNGTISNTNHPIYAESTALPAIDIRTNEPKTLSNMAMPLPPNNTSNESAAVQNNSQIDVPLPLDTDMAIDLPFAPLTSHDECKISDLMPTDCNTESTIDSLLPKEVVVKSKDNVPGVLLIDELGTSGPADDIISNGCKTLSDMALDLPLPPNDTSNESETPDVLLPSDTAIRNNYEIAICVPIPQDTGMAIDLPLAPTSNNESKTSDSVPKDCNMESKIDSPLPKEVVKTKDNVPDVISIEELSNVSNMDHTMSATPDALPADDIITNASKTLTDMAIDMPIPSNDTSNESETPDVPLLSNTAVRNHYELAIYLPHPPVTNMAIDLPLTSITSNNECKTSNSVPMYYSTESTMDSLLPKEVEKPKDWRRGVFSIDEFGVIRYVTEEAADIEMATVSFSTQIERETENESSVLNKPGHVNIYQITKHNINQRKIKLSDPKILQDNFKDIPDCYHQQVITVNVPSEKLLPRNIFLNNTSYALNVQNLKSHKRAKPKGKKKAQRRTITNTSDSENAAVPTPEIPHLLPNAPLYQHPFGYFPRWRPHFPRQHFNQHPYFYRIMHFMPQNFNYNRPPPQLLYNIPRPRHNTPRPRHNTPRPRHDTPRPRHDTPRPRPKMIRNPRPQKQRQRQRQNVKGEHLDAIKNLAHKLKMLPRKPKNSVNSLMGLMARFNEIYHERMRITPDLTVVSDVQENVETIELDDDEVQITMVSPITKSTKYDKYLDNMKKLAARLKNNKRNNQSASKQKRAFQNLLKNFNESFNAELYLDSKGELKDNKLVVLDTSSDSDVVVTTEVVELEQTAKKRRSNGDNNDATKNKKRKLFNPFNILKKVNAGASTSRSDGNLVPDMPIESDSSELLKYFDKNWLPGDDDFGKAIFCFKMHTQHLLSNSQQLYDFVDDSDTFDNWIDLKLSFCDHMEAVTAFEQHLTEQSKDLTTTTTTDKSTLKSILVRDPNDDSSSLEKLRIIKTATDVQETSLRIVFDVYNRDVQNFRKTDPPKPHFRVVCVDECSAFPSGAEVRTVHARCDDNVSTVFAVVGIGSITYLQMNPKDLPIIVRNDD